MIKFYGTIWANRHGTQIENMWYGVQIDESNSSPDLTRIAGSGYASLHASLPVQSLMKACLVADNGTVNYYLDPTDWSKKLDSSASSLDGTDGQVMIEIPAFYYKVEMDTPSSGVHQLKISKEAITGFTLVPKRYVSAYEAAINRNTNTVASVVNTSTDYRGGNNESSYDGNANSLLGCPATNISRVNFRTYSQSRGSGWNMIGYDDVKWIYWLYVIEYATLHTQKAYDGTLTVEGYKKGGLGPGISTADNTEWTTFNDTNPFILCGSSNSLASASGYVDVTKTDFGGSGVNRIFSVPRYRGLENIFGHIMAITDGVIMILQSDADGGENRAYISDNPSNWNDSDYSTYRGPLVLARLKAISKIAILGAYADYLAEVAEGSNSSAYYCDYHYTATPDTTVTRAFMTSGRSADGGLAGMTYVNLDRASGYYSNSFGTRLRFQ
jgi:hypothetical protein